MWAASRIAASWGVSGGLPGRRGSCLGREAVRTFRRHSPESSGEWRDHALDHRPCALRLGVRRPAISFDGAGDGPALEDLQPEEPVPRTVPDDGPIRRGKRPATASSPGRPGTADAAGGAWRSPGPARLVLGARGYVTRHRPGRRARVPARSGDGPGPGEVMTGMTPLQARRVFGPRSASVLLPRRSVPPSWSERSACCRMFRSSWPTVALPARRQPGRKRPGALRPTGVGPRSQGGGAAAAGGLISRTSRRPTVRRARLPGVLKRGTPSRRHRITVPGVNDGAPWRPTGPGRRRVVSPKPGMAPRWPRA